MNLQDSYVTLLILKTMIAQKDQISLTDWQRINNRNVTHLIAVEFLHNLYNRHLPKVNSIRFRNTLTVWKDGVANSYAPISEWKTLNKWVGEKFIRLDKIFLSEIENLITIDRSFIENFLKEINQQNINNLDNIDLGLLLMHLQDFTLGDIYKINVVQLEYPLNNTLLKLLEKYEKNPAKRVKFLSEIIAPGVLTESQLEQIEFLKILKYGQINKIKNPTEDKSMHRKLIQHADKYRFMHCAYGENPATIDDYINKYKEAYPNKLESDQVVVQRVKDLKKNSERVLTNLKDEKIKVLAQLMGRIGTFRDKNKAYLGQTIKYRLMILDEITKRNLETRDNLNYYLTEELLELLSSGNKISQKIITKRKTEGVTLIRSEYLVNKYTIIKKSEVGTKIKSLSGICASQGMSKGVCKVVFNKKDAVKVKKGDILVAIGTDFDLLEAMHLSAGIITEEGGLLSHASVVSREMKKPCCIGVKDATRILKDGMYVELDATKGVIKILK